MNYSLTVIISLFSIFLKACPVGKIAEKAVCTVF